MMMMVVMMMNITAIVAVIAIIILITILVITPWYYSSRYRFQVYPRISGGFQAPVAFGCRSRRAPEL